MARFKDFIVIPLMVFITIVILLSAEIFGAAETVQKEKIKQDIEILESVLNQLIINDSPYLFSGSDQVKGIYLDGFGVMFDFESSGLLSLSGMIGRSIRALPRIRFSSNDDNQLIINVDKDKKDKQKSIDEQAEIEKSLKKTENLIYEFYLDYASTVKSLSDDDRICINIRNSKGFLVDELDNFEVPSQLRACVKVSDLSNYRRGKTNESKMRSQVQIDRIYDKKQDRDLDILERIFDRSLGRSTGSRIIDWDGNTRSMYLDGFGAIFFSPVSAYDRFEHIIIRKAGDLEKKMLQSETKARRMEESLRAREGVIRANEEREKAKEEAAAKSRQNTSQTEPVPPVAPAPPHRIILHDEDNFNFDFDFDKAMKPTDREIDSLLTSITDKIIDVLGQYGPTLRSVKNDESIMVAVDIANHLWDNDWNMLYLKVKKADVDRYARDEISFSKFKKSIVIWKD
ncbi:MAG: hypothetical protein Q7J65_00720 [Candidatus Marinimicrobia bacterium]|nr:hypothetical protein [Candidatus Neomarinimicrobiota bacterium]